MCGANNVIAHLDILAVASLGGFDLCRMDPRTIPARRNRIVRTVALRQALQVDGFIKSHG
jgi:hypothetical protein